MIDIECRRFADESQSPKNLSKADGRAMAKAIGNVCGPLKGFEKLYACKCVDECSCGNAAVASQHANEDSK